MAKFFKRLIGQTIEESLLIQCKIENISFILDQDNQYENLQLEWSRGDTVSRSRVFGETDGTKQANFDVSDCFTQLSIFYKEMKTDPPSYQSKQAQVKIFGQVKTGSIEGRRKSIKGALQVNQKVQGSIGNQETGTSEANEYQEMLGQINIELSNYVYKCFEEVTLPLEGGRISNGQLKVKISVVSIPDAPKIGVDPAHLLDTVPGHMRQLKSNRHAEAEGLINEAEQDLQQREMIIRSQTQSKADQERDEQIYLEMATLKDENVVLKDKVQLLTKQNNEFRSKSGNPRIMLEYFGPFGRADPIRFLLYHSEVKFNDVAVSFEDWGARKAGGNGGEFGCLPIVTVDGSEMGQTNAILRSLGQKYGCYDAADSTAAYKIDVIIDTYTDMFNSAAPILFLMQDKTEEERQEAFSASIQKTQIPGLRLMENQLKELGTDFIAGTSFTIADACVLSLIANLLNAPPLEAGFTPVLANFPKVQEYVARLRHAFKDRLAKRDQSDAPDQPAEEMKEPVREQQTSSVGEAYAMDLVLRSENESLHKKLEEQEEFRVKETQELRNEIQALKDQLANSTVEQAQKFEDHY